jgi:hypothetical protein
MAQARSHYTIDFLYPRGHTESHVIKAYNDHEAIKESEICSIGARSRYGTNPVSFRVRRVSRKSDDVIHSSAASHA